jgi:hypothetical protein
MVAFQVLVDCLLYVFIVLCNVPLFIVEFILALLRVIHSGAVGKFLLFNIFRGSVAIIELNFLSRAISSSFVPGAFLNFVVFA